ncbi:ClpXP protease specificity-enhancing factor [Halomonas llamarensis]|uniref:ClpXP protease specificity-enhancing factor n=1 Tax=Halomonas llamarensis TaxID=2945104 RepID=A0ABT0SM61_9GAMM|nr:ClpXP protease specificity-enhancing factor [Halomonas llamarensis]MCL7928887.1 ClpXP protease specificity-enhancing factor [Halomonas llamarensis]
MRSSRPYLARALYEWLVDNELTPYLVVDATQPDVEVPQQFVQNGQIVLNVAPTAVRDLFMENQAIGFNARFGGQPMQVMIPTPALIAIYARENGAGMVFGHEPELEAEAPEEERAESESHSGASGKPELSVAEPAEQTSDEEGASKDSKSADKSSSSSEAASSKSGASSKKKKPTLRVIK